MGAEIFTERYRHLRRSLLGGFRSRDVSTGAQRDAREPLSAGGGGLSETAHVAGDEQANERVVRRRRRVIRSPSVVPSRNRTPQVRAPT
ncbi:hypothetical protein C474_06982 [Halogeometricum pallidum JCM 14848]|uniref:Uncharacterized protein n=1 Tax=Halogeometricum pallidum JCM 14848 TaxID=1227487 RepID=M0DEH6_HALPD|nr:hypothetical protein [Halogeometricum pallidum]ELZ32544.1 hypothetical protein C474_06982 [Halogeometricum pallidum JCM 14848]